MKKLFIHHFLFRLLSPIFSGIIVYLLILLLNNDVGQLQEEFFGNELYFCIGLSYLIQEFSRFLLLFFKRITVFKSILPRVFFQIVISMILCIVVVTISVKFYFEKILGFDATFEEIITFNSIFCAITFIYISLFLSNEYIYKINTKKLSYEELIKQNIEDDFKQFKKGINPNLLFESLETLLNLIDENPDKTDDFIDNLATIYRYILSAKDKQLVVFAEEIEVSWTLVKLFNYLPYRNISIKNTIENEFLIVPGTILFLMEIIIRKTIVSSTLNLELKLREKDDNFELEYIKNDKIFEEFTIKDVREIEDVFSIYSEGKIRIIEIDAVRKIIIPKLLIQP